MPLVYVILFYFTFFLCFLCFIGLWKKREHSGSLGLNGQEFGKAIRRSRRRWSLWERSSAPAPERPRQWSNAPVFVRKRTRSIIGWSIATWLRSSAPVHEAQTSRNPILEVFSFRVLWILVAQGFKPYDF